MRLPPTTTVGPFVKFRIVEVGRWYFRAVGTHRVDGPESSAVSPSPASGRLTELPPVRVDVRLRARLFGVGWVVERPNRLVSRSSTVDPSRAAPMGAAGRGCRYRRRSRTRGGSRPPVLAGSWTSVVCDSRRGIAATGRAGGLACRLASNRLTAFTGDHHWRCRAGGSRRRRRGSFVVSVSRTWLSLSHVAQL